MVGRIAVGEFAVTTRSERISFPCSSYVKAATPSGVCSLSMVATTKALEKSVQGQGGADLRGQPVAQEGTNQNRLRDQDIEPISRTFHAYADVEKYARVVPLAEIEQNDWNLNISRYVDTSDEEERIDVGEAVRRLRELEQKRAAAEATMNRYLAELGYDL